MSNKDDDIIALEKQYFQGMVDQDQAIVTKLTASDAIVAGPQGVMAVKGAKMGEMMDGGETALKAFAMRDVHVIFPAENVAIIGYNIEMRFDHKGEQMDLVFADTSTWIKGEEAWTCAQHSEAPIGDPTGGKAG